MSLRLNMLTELIIRYPVLALVWLTKKAMAAHKALVKRILIQIRERSRNRKVIADIDKLLNEHDEA